MISTQGAFSARLDAESFLITPHRVDRSTLDVPDLVLVRRGAPEPGKTPSSAAVNHRAIYAAHPEIGAIVTAYPVNATAFSVTDAPLDTRTIPESYLFLREVRRVPYGVQFGDGRELAASQSGHLHRGRQGARRGARPRAAVRPARPRQDHAGPDHRPRARRELPRHLRPGAGQGRRPRRDPDQPRAERRPVHRRDPPPGRQRRGDPLSGDGGPRPRPDDRRGAVGALDPHRPGALHPGRGDHPRRPAGDAAARPLRHPAAARVLHPRRAAAGADARRPRKMGAGAAPTTAPPRSPPAPGARRGWPAGCCAGCATSPPPRARR